MNATGCGERKPCHAPGPRVASERAETSPIQVSYRARDTSNAPLSDRPSPVLAEAGMNDESFIDWPARDRTSEAEMGLREPPEAREISYSNRTRLPK